MTWLITMAIFCSAPHLKNNLHMEKARCEQLFKGCVDKVSSLPDVKAKGFDKDDAAMFCYQQVF